MQKIGIKGCSSGKADFLLEAESRGSPPKSEKRQLLEIHFKKVGGGGGAERGVQPFCEKKKIARKLQNLRKNHKLDCNADSANLLAMTENIRNRRI